MLSRDRCVSADEDHVTARIEAKEATVDSASTLAICRSIIESHGSLWAAYSETRGATVAFTLRLPVNEAP